MDDLDRFLDHNVEGYLFHDLRAMQQISAPEGAPGGGLCYPLLMTAFAGIELLGALLSQNKFNTNAGFNYFQQYWETFLYPTSHQAARQVVYKLARHGIAHAFLLKGPLGVVKGEPAHHLQYNSGTFYIDATELASDLIASYESRVKPFLGATSNSQVNRQTMAQRVGEINMVYREEASASLAPLAAIPASHAVTGASGPGGPPGLMPPISSSVSSSEEFIGSDIAKPVGPPRP